MRARTVKAVVLVVEDSAADALLTTSALETGRIDYDFRVVTDGEAAMAYLRGDAGHEGEPRPDLVLLDLDLPRKDGLEVLADVKSDPNLRRIPVIVLTTSTNPRDVDASYDLHANSYMVKPLRLSEYQPFVSAIEAFWFGQAQIPSEEVCDAVA